MPLAAECKGIYRLTAESRLAYSLAGETTHPREGIEPCGTQGWSATVGVSRVAWRSSGHLPDCLPGTQGQAPHRSRPIDRPGRGLRLLHGCLTFCREECRWKSLIDLHDLRTSPRACVLSSRHSTSYALGMGYARWCCVNLPFSASSMPRTRPVSGLPRLRERSSGLLLAGCASASGILHRFSFALTSRRAVSAKR